MLISTLPGLLLALCHPAQAQTQAASTGVAPAGRPFQTAYLRLSRGTTFDVYKN